MNVSVVIVTYNSCSTIQKCLNSLATYRALEIVLVDNASPDKTVGLIQEKFPEVKLVSLPDNIGFGRACNIGATASSGSFLIFLNPDTVVWSGALKALVAFLEDHPTVGIVGACLIDPLGQPLQSMGDRPSVLGLVLDKPMAWMAKRVQSRGLFRSVLGLASAKFRLPSEPESVSWVSGAALCCRRSLWKSIGGFDEKFFLYYEDVDLCLRASQAGWGVWHLPAAVVSHQSGASFAGSLDFQKHVYFANQLYFFQKHYGPYRVFFLSLFQKIYFHLNLYRYLANDRIGPSIEKFSVLRNGQ